MEPLQGKRVIELQDIGAGPFCGLPPSAVAPGQQTDEILDALGLSADEIATLKSRGAIA